MLKIKSYVKVNSLAEAYELNQKKTARILGGMVWMKMGNRAISTAIDLSGLGLDAISENDDEFVIGCMTPLHDLETNEALNTYTPVSYTHLTAMRRGSFLCTFRIPFI